MKAHVLCFDYPCSKTRTDIHVGLYERSLNVPLRSALKCARACVRHSDTKQAHLSVTVWNADTNAILKHESKTLIAQGTSASWECLHGCVHLLCVELTSTTQATRVHTHTHRHTDTQTHTHTHTHTHVESTKCFTKMNSQFGTQSSEKWVH